MMMKLTSTQESLLLKEAGLASSSIGHGLTLLRKADNIKKSDYYQSFFQLSIGLERLMKLIIIEKYLGEEKRFPDNKTLKDYGHKLIDLFDMVSKFEDGKLINPKDNLVCNKILNILSEFSLSSRYYNLDTLTNRQTNNLDPLVEWKQVQDEIRKLHKRRISRKDLINFELSKIIDGSSVTRFYDADNSIVSSYSDLFIKTYDTDYVQGYATIYTLKIIQYLVNILKCIENQYKLYPYLREFFFYYTGSWGSDAEVRRKRNWINS